MGRCSNLLQTVPVNSGLSIFNNSRNSVVGIATSYGLEVSVSQEFSLLHVVQTGSGVHPTSSPMGIGSSLPGVKRSGREADHSPPASAEVKKTCLYIHSPARLLGVIS
jgi:hypothetical protein